LGIRLLSRELLAWLQLFVWRTGVDFLWRLRQTRFDGVSVFPIMSVP
jgi:hypothetical protein